MESIQASLDRHDRQVRERHLLTWAKELGIPAAPVVALFEHGEFKVDAVGTPVAAIRPTLGALSVPHEGGTMIAWGVRIRRAGCRAYVEARMIPSRGLTYTMQDLDLADHRANARALAGLDLLRAWKEPAGRRSDCLERCQAAADAIAEQGKTPTQSGVARLLNVNLETVEQCFSRERSRSGRTWRESKRAALRKAGRAA